MTDTLQQTPPPEPSTDRTSDKARTNGNSRGRVIIASTIGTTIEFYDFYAYATAAVVVFPDLFFPKSENSTVGLLASLATFGLAFVARPVGSVLFGHFGDRIGRKATLIGALLTMGIATFIIGCLPTYDQIGLWAPALLALLRLFLSEPSPVARLCRGLDRIGIAVLICYAVATFLASVRPLHPLSWLLVWLGVVATHVQYGIRFLQGFLFGVPQHGTVKAFDHQGNARAEKPLR